MVVLKKPSATIGLKLFVVLFAVLSTASCATTYLVGRQTVDPEAENVTYMDDQPIYTSVIENSVLEFQFVPRETIYSGSDLVGEPIQGSFFLQNVSDEDLDYFPSDVWLFVWVEGVSRAEGVGGLVSVYLYRGTDDIDLYAESVARASVQRGYANTTGGLYTYLSGGTIGESIIASNQARSERARAQRETQAAVEESTTALDEFLLGRTTVESGEIISGGVGFVDAGNRFAPATPLTDEIIQAWRDGGYYGVEFADSLEAGTPLLEQIIANPAVREEIQAHSDRRWQEVTGGEQINVAGFNQNLPGPALNPYTGGMSGFARIDAVSGLLLFETENGIHRVPVAIDVQEVRGDEASPVSFPYTP